MYSLSRYDEPKVVGEPDLLYGKLLYEERLKNALQYNLHYQSPIWFLNQF
jgi:hypothetical protein